MSLIKFHYDIARPRNSENFHRYLNIHQDTRPKQLKVVKTEFGVKSIVRQCVQK